MKQHQEWLRRYSKDGDAEAFAALVREYSGMVYATCLRVARNPHDAEDAAQKCFLELALKSQAIVSSISGWLHAAATNHALSGVRAQAARRERERISMAEPVPGRELRWEELAPSIDEALEELPDEFRLPLILHYLQGKNQTEVADELGIDQSTVSRRIERGLEELRERLKKAGVIAPVLLLGTLLKENASAAVVPATLLAALGKMAMAGFRRTASNTIASSGTGWTAAAKVAGACIAVAAIAIVGVRALRHTQDAATPSAPTQTAPSGLPATGSTVSRPDASTPSAAPAHEVRGLVVDRENRPVPAAQVVLASGKKAMGRARTDDEGRFRLPLQAAGSNELYAFKSEIGVAVHTDVRSGDLAEPVRLEPLGCVGGRFLDRDTGQPIAGLPIVVGGTQIADPRIKLAISFFAQMGTSELKTDKDGRYRLADRVPANYRFKALPNAANYTRGYGAPQLHVSLAPGECLTNHDLALARGGAISGTVRDASGNPLLRAEVELWPADRASSFDWDYHKQDGTNGTYRFDCIPVGVRCHIIAEYDGYARAKSELVELVEPGEVTGVDVRLNAGHVLRGRLTDDTGKPIAGVEIALRGIFGSRTNTATDGAFEFLHVGAGEQEVFVHGTDPGAYDLSNGLEFSMPAGEDVDDLLIVLKRNTPATPGFVTGRVTDDQGVPLRNARIVAYGTGGSGVTLTDTNGVYRFDKLRDVTRLTIDVYATGYADARLYDVKLNSTDVDFKVDRLGWMRGRVLDAETGAPVPRCEIRHTYFRPRADYGGEQQSQWFPVVSPEGEFRLDEVAPTTCLEVRAPGYAIAKTERITFPPGGTVTGLVVRLTRGQAIHGRVVDAVTDKPLAGVRVRASDITYFRTSILRDHAVGGFRLGEKFEVLAMTDMDGHFNLDSLPSGMDISIISWRDGYETRIFPSVRAEVLPPGDFTIRLAAEGRLAIRVVGQNPSAGPIYIEASHQEQEPAPLLFDEAQGCFVRSAAESDMSFNDRARVTFDGDQGQEFTQLPAGTYRIVLVSDGEGYRQLGVFWAEVEAGKTANLDIDLDTLSSYFGTIHGKIENPEAAKSAYASVLAMDDPHDSPVTELDADGSFRVTGLPPGDYLVGINLDGTSETSRKSEYTVHVEAGQDVELKTAE